MTAGPSLCRLGVEIFFFWNVLYVEEVIWNDQIMGKWQPVGSLWLTVHKRLLRYSGSPIAFPVNSPTGSRVNNQRVTSPGRLLPASKEGGHPARKTLQPWNMQALTQPLACFSMSGLVPLFWQSVNRTGGRLSESPPALCLTLCPLIFKVLQRETEKELKKLFFILKWGQVIYSINCSETFYSALSPLTQQPLITNHSL